MLCYRMCMYMRHYPFKASWNKFNSWDNQFHNAANDTKVEIEFRCERRYAFLKYHLGRFIYLWMTKTSLKV
uniref:Uncharacterized protein n=1 Tax=Onchocerca volvulus TaxID=6282 RepID=A0A8R1Y693_ONCVO